MTNENLNSVENDILGFDPSQLTVYQEQPQQTSGGNPNIYHPKPALSKAEDGVYRSQIKVIYNPWDLRNSILEQQSYALQDSNGFFSVVSSLTNNDKNCPVFKAWKQCHFSKDENMQKQALTKDKGGRGLFDKRYARYALIQVIEDNNQPDLVGKYMFWKLPKAIWETINAKMAPSPESKKASIPVMDFLFGRAIDLEVTPGPDDPKAPERKTREISYNTSELTDDVVSCTNPDGSPLLDDDQQAILDQYVEEMTKKVWKQKDPDLRATALAEINAEENTKKLRELYHGVIEKIKSFCPNLIEELGYHEWSPEVTARVNAWINVVLAGNDPTNPLPSTTTTTAPSAAPSAAPSDTTESTPTAGSDDLPF